MEKKLLRVLAHGDACVPDYEKQELGVRKMIGRVYRERSPGVFGFEPTGEVVEVPADNAEYIKALRAGGLKPADKETAELAHTEAEPVTFEAKLVPRELASGEKLNEAGGVQPAPTRAVIDAAGAHVAGEPATADETPNAKSAGKASKGDR